MKTKGAESDVSAPIPTPGTPAFRPFGESIRKEVLRQVELGLGKAPNPIDAVLPQGRLRVWLAYNDNGTPKIGDASHWALAARGAAAANRTAPRAEKGQEPLPSLKGFRVRLSFQHQAPSIGSGWRVVTCQFRGKKVILHHAGYTATLKREVFKEVVGKTRECIERNRSAPKLRLVVSNPPRVDSMEEAA